MSELLVKQQTFFRLLPSLFLHATFLGFEASLGDGYRDPRVFGDIGVKKGYGHSKSAHKQRLAVDINLYKDGEYCKLTEDHKELGEFWESLHPDNRWGGRFNDGNHYSHLYNGIR